MSVQAVSVSQFLALLNETLRQAFPSRMFFIEGEVSDYRVSQNKWVSFDLKDEQAEAVLKCFATVWTLATPLENGMRVRVCGTPKVYERYGTFSLSVDEVALVGEGSLKRAYELLKKKLQTEGLFDSARKRNIPRFPERIGLVTSTGAAAYGDFLRVIQNRWSGVEILVCPVHVQGKEAVGDILEAFAIFNALPELKQPEVLVLTRGGGGLEDLHAFNDEQVARAVFQSVIPVVCGVGHERDESLCDFVADVRASTPSNAAERVVPDRRDIARELEQMRTWIEDRLELQVSRRQDRVEHAARIMSGLLERQSARIVQSVGMVQRQSAAWFARVQDRVVAQVRLLRELDPKRPLARGYALATVGGQVLRDATGVDIGAEIQVQLAHGSLDAEVLRKNGRGKQKLI